MLKRRIYLPFHMLCCVLAATLMVGAAHASEAIYSNAEKIQIGGIQHKVDDVILTSERIAKMSQVEGKGESVKKFQERLILNGIQFVEALLERASEIKNSQEHRAEYRAITSLLEELHRVQRGLGNLLPSPFIIKSSSKSEVHTNFRVGYYDLEGRFTVGPGAVELGQSRSARLKGKLWRLGTKSIDATTNFGKTYAAFMVATGMLTFAHLATNYEKNPTGLDQFINHATDPLGAVSFAAFIAVSHKFQAVLEGLRTKMIPKSFIPYLGMAAGMLASSIFYEMAIDANLHTCISSGFTDVERCDRAFDTWVGGAGKAEQYAPAVVSLLSAAVGSALITSGAVKGLQLYGQTKSGQALFSGLWMGPRTKAVAQAAGKVLQNRFILMTGSFVVFLALEKQISPYIHGWAEDHRLRVWDFKPYMSKEWGFHRDYLRWMWGGEPAPGDVFRIANAFEVEATNLPEVDRYVKQMFSEREANNWLVPEDRGMLTCFIKGYAEVASDNIKLVREGERTRVVIENDQMYSKPQSMFECEVLSQPNKLLERYSEVEEAWRSHLLTSYYTSMLSWTQWSTEFSRNYINAFKLYEYLAQVKNDEHRGGAKPDLSKLALSRKMLELQGAKIPKDATEGQIITAARGPLTFLLQRMACGEAPSQSEFVSNAEKAMAMAFNYPDYNSFRTPIGSPARFLPPVVIESPDKKPTTCSLKSKSLAYEGIRQRMRPDREKTKRISEMAKEGKYNYIFDTQWKDSEGQEFESLAQLVYDKLDPVMWKSKRSRRSRFNIWWREAIKKPVKEIWQYYQNKYKSMYFKSFIPMFVAVSNDCQGCDLPMATAGVLESFYKESKTYNEAANKIIDKLKSEQMKTGELVDLQNYINNKNQEFAELYERGSQLSAALGAVNPDEDKNYELRSEIVKNFIKGESGAEEKPFEIKPLLLALSKPAPEKKEGDESGKNKDEDAKDSGSKSAEKESNRVFDSKTSQRLGVLIPLVRRIENLVTNRKAMLRYLEVMNFEGQQTVDLDKVPKKDTSNPYISR